MKYLDMLPYQVRQAIDNRYPVAFPLGVIEYHAEHLPFGVDSYVAMEILERVEKRRPELVILPQYYYGCASFAVAPPERNGTVQVDCTHIIPMAEDIFRSLLRVGFRNIHCFIAHQGEQFDQGMPTDLAFRTAAKHVIFDWLEKESGEGWWGTEKFANYYEGANDPFKWIQVHPTRHTAYIKSIMPGDHAGKVETSETMVIRPESVRMDLQDDRIWFSRPAREATREYGEWLLNELSYEFEETLFGDVKR